VAHRFSVQRGREKHDDTSHSIKNARTRTHTIWEQIYMYSPAASLPSLKKHPFHSITSSDIKYIFFTNKIIRLSKFHGFLSLKNTKLHKHTTPYPLFM